MNKIKKSIFEIFWIVIQIVILWFTSKFLGLKSWSDFCKGILIFILLVCTLLQWFNKKTVFCTLLQWFNKKTVYRKIKNLTNKLIKHICKAFKGVDVFIKEPGGVLIIIFSDILKVLYIYISFSILIKLVYDKDITNIINYLIVIYIYILLLSRLIQKTIFNTGNVFVIALALFVLFLCIQLSDFDEFIVPVNITVVIPLVNWYYSESGQQFINKRSRGSSIVFKDETKMEWVFIKAVNVLFSVSLGIVVILKKFSVFKDNVLQNLSINKNISVFNITSDLLIKFNQSTALTFISVILFLIMFYIGPIFLGANSRYLKNQEQPVLEVSESIEVKKEKMNN